MCGLVWICLLTFLSNFSYKPNENQAVKIHGSNTNFNKSKGETTSQLLYVALFTYLLSCLLAKITPIRAMLAAIPIDPRVKIRAASAVPPGWHWKTLVAFRLALAALLPNRRFAPIMATAEPENNRFVCKTIGPLFL